MAMYEDLGFCPNNQFLSYQVHEDPVPEIWDRTKEILGDRKGYMVYTEAGDNYNGWCHVVDCLVGAKSTIGVEIASLLRTMIPHCEYAKTGRKILVTDVINPHQIPCIYREYIGNTEKFMSCDDSMHIFEDERYVCGVTDEGESIHMYFFKKYVISI